MKKMLCFSIWVSTLLISASHLLSHLVSEKASLDSVRAREEVGGGEVQEYKKKSEEKHKKNIGVSSQNGAYCLVLALSKKML